MMGYLFYQWKLTVYQVLYNLNHWTNEKKEFFSNIAPNMSVWDLYRGCMREVSLKKQILNNNKPLLNYYNHDTFIIQAISWIFCKWDRYSLERCLVVGHIKASPHLGVLQEKKTSWILFKYYTLWCRYKWTEK